MAAAVAVVGGVFQLGVSLPSTPNVDERSWECVSVVVQLTLRTTSKMYSLVAG